MSPVHYALFSSCVFQAAGLWSPGDTAILHLPGDSQAALPGGRLAWFSQQHQVPPQHAGRPSRSSAHICQRHYEAAPPLSPFSFLGLREAGPSLDTGQDFLLCGSSNPLPHFQGPLFLCLPDQWRLHSLHAGPASEDTGGAQRTLRTLSSCWDVGRGGRGEALGDRPGGLGEPAEWRSGAGSGSGSCQVPKKTLWEDSGPGQTHLGREVSTPHPCEGKAWQSR